MKNLIFLFALVVYSCAHKEYDKEVSSQDIDKIQQATKKHCPEKCEVDKCRYINKDVLFCNVAFSFAPDSYKKEVLQKIENTLSQEKLKVGFCGGDSVGTELFSAFLDGLFFGDDAVVMGSYSETQAVHENQELAKKACY